MRRMRAGLLVVAVMLALTVVPSMAMAEGGKSIATATPITYGQQEFGNTAEGQYWDDGDCDEGRAWRSYWALSVTAGDLVTINWEANLHTELELMPVGTTDFTLSQTRSALWQEPASNGKNQAQYTVPQSGVMPLFLTICRGYTPGPGPYSFTVTAQHALALRLTSAPAVLPNSTIYGNASLISGAPVPDGLVFTLTATWSGGSASYNASSIGGGLSFPLALPESAEGKTVALVLSRAADAEYLEVKTGTLKVKVAGPRVAIPTTHRRRHHRRHRHHHRRHRHHRR